MLVQVEGAWNILRDDPKGRQSLGQILIAAVIGNLVDLPRIVFAESALLFGELKAVAAAHALLQVVSAFFKAVRQDGHHMWIVAGHQLVTRRDEYFHVVDLGGGMVE